MEINDLWITRKPKNRKNRHFNFWADKLLTIAAGAFKWQNLPANLPQWEIEKRLILCGRCFVFKNEVYGIITSFGATSGVDIYNNSSEFNYAQAILGAKSGLINMVDGVIMYGTSIDKWNANGGTLRRKLEYYADILSDISVSRQIGIINNRAITSPIAKNDNALRELKQFYDGIERGEQTIPRINSGVLDSTEPLLKDVKNAQGYTMSDFNVAEENILKQFYADFGIQYATEKRERLITDEVQADLNSLDINVADMLQCRIDGANAINTLYGTNVKVEVNNIDIAGIPKREHVVDGFI